MIEKDNALEYLNLAIRIFRRQWSWLLIGMLSGVVIALVFSLVVTPRYRSSISFCAWNKSVSDAIGEINNGEAKTNQKTQAVLMFSNIISQSMNIGQRLISDYKKLITSQEVVRE